ncbi:MAG: GNAT family N-acetyltransferase [Anaerolinea sp.]|nr:GNAT family N-acetyltransferase [Anaerolinea sp.]
MMLFLRQLTSNDVASLNRLIEGYTSFERYDISWRESEVSIDFQLQLIHLPKPYVKRFDLASTASYEHIVEAGLSLALFDGNTLAAIALSTLQDWNRSFWLHEFHVRENYRGQGAGRQLMNAVKEKARSRECRIVVCETQNTNVPAIRFYRRMGFRVEAVDISLYSNSDFPDQEIALFMKCRLD